MKQPRGVRNNNPGNLRVSHANNWRGKLRGSTKRDKQFEEFETLEYGYRALLITLRNYITKHKLRTLRQIIARWAPPNENDTEAYIKSASMYSDIPAGTFFSATDEVRLTRLAYAIGRVECGEYVGTMEVVRKAWEMI